jgi:hypothetical protein
MGESVGVNNLDATLSAGMGLAGHPMALGYPALMAAVRKGILSGPGQKLLTTPGASMLNPMMFPAGALEAEQGLLGP